MKSASLLRLLWLLVFPFPASAYGPEGHKIIGAIADQRLARSATADRVTRLLDGYTLQQVSTIPDTIRQWDESGIDDPRLQEYFSSHPRIAAQLREFWKANPPTENKDSPVPSHHWFHYTDVPLVGNERYANGKTGRSKWDVIHTTRYCIQVLEGKVPETNERKITKPIALILLDHLIGDIHQPLHVGAEYFDRKGNPANPDQVHAALSDEGGNSLRLHLADTGSRRRDGRFHAFWDVDAVLGNLPVLSESMPKEERRARMQSGERSVTTRLAQLEPKDWRMPASISVEDYPEAWANEILPVAREAHRRLHYHRIRPRLEGESWIASGEIVEKPGENNISYREWATRMVYDEMHKAGWRLSDLLEKLLQPNDKP
jgi:hypothetical protein